MQLTVDQKLSFKKYHKSFDAIPEYHAMIDDIDLIKFQEFLENRKHAEEKETNIEDALRANLSRSTPWRIEELLDEKLIKKVGKGHGTYYKRVK